MKSPRCESSSSPIGVSSEIGSLAIFEHLAHFFERHGELFGQFLRRRLAADFVQHLARGAHDLVDRLDHMHGNADGARLIGDRAGDRLPDPPGRIGREFIAAAIFELIDRLHQADIAFLNEVEELQAAIGVFLGDGDDETQIGLDHFLLGLARLALALLHHMHNFSGTRNSRAPSRRERVDVPKHKSLIRPCPLRQNPFRPHNYPISRARRPNSDRVRSRRIFEEILARDACEWARRSRLVSKPMSRFLMS